MSGHKRLGVTKLFWLSFLGPIFLGVLFGFGVWKNEPGLVFCFSSGCLENFYNYYKFPLALSGFSLPLVAMVAALHRSRETSLQISQSVNQLDEVILNNRFGNYLKHREAFDKIVSLHCDATKRRGRGLVVSSVSLYAAIYTQTGFNNKSWTPDFVPGSSIEKIDKSYATLIDQAYSSTADFDVVVFCKSLRELSQLLYISYEPLIWAIYNIDDGNITLPVWTLDNKWEAVSGLIIDIFSICELIRSYSGIPYKSRGEIFYKSNLVYHLSSALDKFKLVDPDERKK